MQETETTVREKSFFAKSTPACR